MKKGMIALGVTSIILAGVMTMFGFFGCGAKKYRVDYDGHKDWFSGAKDEYRAGEKVTFYYYLVATDTDYSFYVDGERINALYDDDHGFKISFTMPDHDVKVTVKSVNSMIYDPTAYVDSGEPAKLTYHSFEGGGPEYSAEIEDGQILFCSSRRYYADDDHEELDGAGYDVVLIFTGLKSGETDVTITCFSPIDGNYEEKYHATVNEDLDVTLEAIDE